MFLRTLRPTAHGAWGDAAIVGAAQAWDAIDDPFGTRVVRGPAPTTTTLADDTAYLRFDAPGRVTFLHLPCVGDSDISTITFRARIASQIGSGEVTAQAIMRRGGVDTDLGALNLPNPTNGVFVDLTREVAIDPATGAAWSPDHLATPALHLLRPFALGALISGFTIATSSKVGDIDDRGADAAATRISALVSDTSPLSFIVRADPAALLPDGDLRVTARLRVNHGLTDGEGSQSGSVGQTRPIEIGIRVGGTTHALGTVTVTSTGAAPTSASWTTQTLATTTNPATGAAWRRADLAAAEFVLTALPALIGVQVTQFFLVVEAASATDTEFGIRLATGTIFLSRFDAEAALAVGPTQGRDRRGENWRTCDVCGRPTPYSRILRPLGLHPQTGLAVCPVCYDEPDHDTLKAMSGKVPRDRQDVLY